MFTPKNCATCARGVDRRTFLSVATTVAVLAVLEGCATAPDGVFTGSYGGPFTVTLASFTQLATVGGVARVDDGTGAPTALYRSGAASFVALSMVCPHAGFAPIDITVDGFRCPLHGSTFSNSGALLGGPAATGLTSYAATYDASGGTVTIDRPT